MDNSNRFNGASFGFCVFPSVSICVHQWRYRIDLLISFRLDIGWQLSAFRQRRPAFRTSRGAGSEIVATDFAVAGKRLTPA